MLRRRGIATLIMTLLLISAIAIAGFVLYRAGYSQGFAVGQLADGGSVPAMPPYGFVGFGFLPWLCFTGFAFFLGLFFLRFALFGGFLRNWGWRAGPGCWGRGHGKHPHWHEQKEQAESPEVDI